MEEKSIVENGKRKLFKNKLSDTLPILYLITMVLVILGQSLGSFLGLIPFTTSTGAAMTATMYFLFIGIWILTILYLRFTKKNRPILKAIGRQAKGNNWKNLLLGFAIGFGLNGLCILVAWLHNDISLYYDSFHPLYFVMIFIAVFVQSSAEELVCRGFLYQRLRRSYKSPAVAIIGNSLLFALMHLTNDGVTALSVLNIFVVGILFSLIIWIASGVPWLFMRHGILHKILCSDCQTVEW